MPEFKHKLNTGSAFRNNKKDIETKPDCIGSCNIEGKDYWINVFYTGKEVPLMRFIFNAKDVTGEAANDNAKQEMKAEGETVTQQQPANDNTVQTRYVYVQKPR